MSADTTIPVSIAGKSLAEGVYNKVNNYADNSLLSSLAPLQKIELGFEELFVSPVYWG